MRAAMSGEAATLAVLGGLLAYTAWRRRQDLAGEWLPGGEARGRSPEDFDPAQLARGTDVEMEHVRGGAIPMSHQRAIAREIAMDHLAEDPAYYRKLAKVHLDRPLGRSFGAEATRQQPGVYGPDGGFYYRLSADGRVSVLEPTTSTRFRPVSTSSRAGRAIVGRIFRLKRLSDSAVAAVLKRARGHAAARERGIAPREGDTRRAASVDPDAPAESNGAGWPEWVPWAIGGTVVVLGLGAAAVALGGR